MWVEMVGAPSFMINLGNEGCTKSLAVHTYMNFAIVGWKLQTVIGVGVGIGTWRRQQQAREK